MASLQTTAGQQANARTNLGGTMRITGSVPFKAVCLLLVSSLLAQPAVAYASAAPQSATDMAMVIATAEADAQHDVSSASWLAVGCLLGILGVVIAYVSEPRPPAMRMLGKSPEYVAAYTDAYSRAGKDKKTKNAWIGFAVGTAIWVGIIVLAYSSTDDVYYY